MSCGLSIALALVAIGQHPVVRNICVNAQYSYTDVECHIYITQSIISCACGLYREIMQGQRATAQARNTINAGNLQQQTLMFKHDAGILMYDSIGRRGRLTETILTIH